MGVHDEGFGFDYEREKYLKLKPLLLKYCNDIDYTICDDGILNFKGSNGCKYEVLYFKEEEYRYEDGTKSFASICNESQFEKNCLTGVEGYNYNSKTKQMKGPIVSMMVVSEPIEVINFMIEKNTKNNL